MSRAYFGHNYLTLAVVAADDPELLPDQNGSCDDNAGSEEDERDHDVLQLDLVVRRLVAALGDVGGLFELLIHKPIG